MKENTETTTDNDTTWTILSAVTEKLVLKLEKEHRPDRTDNRAKQDLREQDEKRHREYVEYRLRQLAKFEAMANGGKRRT